MAQKKEMKKDQKKQTKKNDLQEGRCPLCMLQASTCAFGDKTQSKALLPECTEVHHGNYAYQAQLMLHIMFMMQSRGSLSSALQSRSAELDKLLMRLAAQPSVSQSSWGWDTLYVSFQSRQAFPHLA
jgi:hypothetical protein